MPAPSSRAHRPLRIAILNQFYLPDISPTAQLAGSLAEHRADLGDEVTVIASDRRYAAVESGRSADHPGVRVCRAYSPGFGKRSTILRALDYLSYFTFAALQVVMLPRQDVVITMTTPPYVVLLALLHRFRYRKPRVILWVMDCYPEVPEMTGMLKRSSLVSRVLRAVNRFVFRQVSHVITLDCAMTGLLRRQYEPSPGQPPMSVIPNWERSSQFPGHGTYPVWPGIARHQLAGRHLVLYLGNAGAGHAFETVLDAAEQLRADPVTFLFVGGGSRWKEIEQAKVSRNLTNIILTGYVPKEETGALMAACHASLITLRDDAAGLISPSKLHASLACGLPILYVGPVGSNVDEALARFPVGASLRHGDVPGVVRFVRGQITDRSRRAEYTRAARAAFDEAYCDRRTLPAFDRIIDEEWS
jgi:glycosyltransferase involved in cell wall biosynthesis